MAFFSLRAYDADVRIPSFLGIKQDDVSLNADIRYATEALNVETPDGALQPHAGYRVMTGEFEHRIETLASFSRRWYDGPGKKEWLVCSTGGKIYSRQVGDNVGWLEIELPSGVTAFTNNTWSWVTYEINQDGIDHPLDVLLMSNQDDGMIMVIPPDRPSLWKDNANKTWGEGATETWRDFYSPDWVIQPIDTRADTSQGTIADGPKFGIIERYAERIWGGMIKDEPDTLIYSRSYDPTDWTGPGAEEEPEVGGGEIRQPSWDGDKFTALKSFGSQLLAFKANRIWRVMGTDPGEYTFKEQFGGGAPYVNTIAVDVERVLMAYADGLAVYDGMSVSPYAREQFKEIWSHVNTEAMDQMVGTLFKDRYYLAFPVDGSAVNNALLVFNKVNGTILYYRDVEIESMLATTDELYATSSSLPGKSIILRYDSWKDGQCSGAATRWVSPWMDFGRKDIRKGGMDLYFQPEVKDTAVTITFKVQTEKKIKSKTYTVQPLTEASVTAGKSHKMKRIHIGGVGRRFRVIIETAEGAAVWRLIGGIQMIVETDPD
jgi:hypothetical protein